MRRSFVSAAIALVLVCAPLAQGTEFLTHSAAEITTALQSAKPGDTIVMANGTWTDQHINFNINGNASNPITLRAQTSGRVILTGTSTLSISGDFLIADGLQFKDGGLTGGNIVALTSSASHSRLTNSAIVDYNPPDINTDYNWVRVDGDHNRVDHNFFKGKTSSGRVVEVQPVVRAQDQVDNNHFVDRPVGNGNGFETIRIGLSSTQSRSAQTLVERNLFERMDGELEIISNKTSNNIIRNNTFRASKGTLTLRHGHGTLVEGNFFLGENVADTGGIRVIGPDHTVINNYMQDLTTNAISLTTGLSDFNLQENATTYEPVSNVLIAHNTIVNDSDRTVTLDAGYSSSTTRNVRPANLTIANNILYSTKHTLMSGTEGSGWTWAGNIASGSSLGVSAHPGLNTANPLLVKDATGLWRPAPNSPAINQAATGAWTPPTLDIDGQTRVNPLDIGADEIAGTGPITNQPLSGSDVGPSWLKRRTIALDKFPQPVLMMEAEDYTAVRDPNGNQLTWSIVNAPGTSGGKILKAPAGPTTNLPGTQDAIVDYDVAFHDAGTYFLYLLARGPDALSDSLYSPLNLGDDPTVIEDVPGNGNWTWVELASYSITATQVNRPITVQIGRRDGSVEMDMLIFSPVRLNLQVPEPIALGIGAATFVILRRTRRRISKIERLFGFGDPSRSTA